MQEDSEAQNDGDECGTVQGLSQGVREVPGLLPESQVRRGAVLLVLEEADKEGGQKEQVQFVGWGVRLGS